MKFPFRRQIASILSVTIMLTSVMPVRAQAQTAPPICYTDSTTMEGKSANCGAVTRAGQNFSFPKLAWEEVGQVDLTVDKKGAAMVLGKPSDNLGSMAAEALGLEEKDIVQAIKTYPTNVPIVFARYSTWDASLTVDIFKLEKTITKARMLHATFSPEHGDIWAASGAYASVGDRQAGAVGRNPFAVFKDGSGRFSSISYDAAQVAIGHAQRLVQAPISILAVVNSNIRPTTTKRSCGLKKCVTTKYWLDLDTKWFLGVPANQAHSSLAVMPAGYCVTNPSTAGAACATTEFATAGVAFMPQEGGTFNSEQVTQYIDEKTKKSWGLLGILLVTFVAAFAFSFIATAMAPGIGAGTASAGSGLGMAGAGVSSGGLLTSALQLTGTMGSIGSYAAAAAIETALTAGVLVGLGGADLSSSMNFGSPGFTSQTISATAAAVNPNDQSDPIVQKGIRMTKPLTVGKLETSLAPIRNTLVGTCGIAGKGSDCSGKSQGIVQRADQLVQTNNLQMYREADGNPIEYVQ